MGIDNIWHYLSDIVYHYYHPGNTFSLISHHQHETHILKTQSLESEFENLTPRCDTSVKSKNIAWN